MFQKTFFYLLGIISLTFWGCMNNPSAGRSGEADTLFHNKEAYTILKNQTTRPKAFAAATDIHVVLDSLSEIKVMGSLRNGKRLIQIDGMIHFKIDHADQPVVIYTGMMKLNTQNADFQINAYSSSPGQALRVFRGQLIATKSYESDFPNTDTLGRGGMILINRDIDLMEKETFDTTMNAPQPL